MRKTVTFRGDRLFTYETAGDPAFEFDEEVDREEMAKALITLISEHEMLRYEVQSRLLDTLQST